MFFLLQQDMITVSNLIDGPMAGSDWEMVRKFYIFLKICLSWNFKVFLTHLARFLQQLEYETVPVNQCSLSLADTQVQLNCPTDKSDHLNLPSLDLVDGAPDKDAGDYGEEQYVDFSGTPVDSSIYEAQALSQSFTFQVNCYTTFNN